MKYEKIRGKSASECMMKLRSKYGTSAIILSTREIKAGGLLGSGLFAKSEYEIDFMLEEKGQRNADLLPNLKRKPESYLSPEQVVEKSGIYNRLPIRSSLESRDLNSRAAAAESYLNKYKKKDIPSVEATAIPTPESAEPLNRLQKASQEEIEALFRDERMHDASLEHEEVLSDEESNIVDNALLPVEKSEEAEVVKPNKNQTPAKPLLRRDESEIGYFHRIRNRMLSSHLSSDFIDIFLNKLDNSLSLNEKKEFHAVEVKSLDRLAEMIKTTPDLAIPNGECRAIMLIGPSGMGKTTSIAKLAARYHIMQQRDVSLYSIDHYRLAATEQLKTYAGVMGLPFNSPLTPAEFGETIRRDGAEIMLIDTSGISHRDTARLEALKAFADECEVKLEKHLVLAASTSPDLIEKILLAYNTVGFDKIILSKVDETDFIGGFVECADKINRPFSFLMNGQEVPGDIVEAQPLEMAKMVLKEELSR